MAERISIFWSFINKIVYKINYFEVQQGLLYSKYKKIYVFNIQSVVILNKIIANFYESTTEIINNSIII